MNATIYAVTIWNAIVIPVHFQEPISFFIAPTAAKQGMQSKLNAIYANADAWVNTAESPGSAALPSAAASATASAAPNNTPNVETIFSLAIHPVTTATDALH